MDPGPGVRQCVHLLDINAALVNRMSTRSTPDFTVDECERAIGKLMQQISSQPKSHSQDPVSYIVTRLHAPAMHGAQGAHSNQGAARSFSSILGVEMS